MEIKHSHDLKLAVGAARLRADHERERHAAEIAQEKEKAFNAGHDGAMATQRQYYEERLAQERANWQARLDESEAHRILNAAQAEKFADTIEKLCASKSEAVARATAEAARLVDEQADKWTGFVNAALKALAEEIRQRAAEPQEDGLAVSEKSKTWKERLSHQRTTDLPSNPQADEFLRNAGIPMDELPGGQP